MHVGNDLEEEWNEVGVVERKMSLRVDQLVKAFRLGSVHGQERVVVAAYKSSENALPPA